MMQGGGAMEISPLVLRLRELIKNYCIRYRITTVTAFAELARVDRDTISDICNKSYYFPSWKVVTAIAVAVDMPTEQIKSVLGPLYDKSQIHARQTTARQRAIRKGDISMEGQRDGASERVG